MLTDLKYAREYVEITKLEITNRNLIPCVCYYQGLRGRR